jgi:hypothetical protein
MIVTSSSFGGFNMASSNTGNNNSGNQGSGKSAGNQSGTAKSGNSNDGNQPAGDGGQTLEEARENGRKGAKIAKEMRDRGELSADNSAGTMKEDGASNDGGSTSNRKNTK